MKEAEGEEEEERRSLRQPRRLRHRWPASLRRGELRLVLVRTRTRSAVSPSGAASPSGSPRLRPTGLPAIVPSNSTEVPTIGPRSPLGALFGARRERAVSMAGVEASVKRVEAVVDEVKRMPVNRLKDEMKELQVRDDNGLRALLRVADADRRCHCFLAGPTSEDRELAVDADTGNEERHWTPLDDTSRLQVKDGHDAI